MRLITQTHALASSHEPEEAIRIIKDAGFDGIDWSFFEMTDGPSPFLKPDYLETAQRLREAADAAGIPILQAHAPFPSSRGSEPYDTEIHKRIIRSMEAASVMGVRHIVVHPKQHIPYAKNKDALFELNVRFYESLIPECERLDITVCLENMWTRDSRRGYIVESVCASPEEFSGMLDAIGSPYIGGCLDLGHTALIGIEPEDFIRAVGSRHLTCLHVHDVDYVRDCHTLPFQQKLHWDKICLALKEVGYQGDFTFEADNFLFPVPKELQPAASSFMCRVGRYLVAQITD